MTIPTKIRFDCHYLSGTGYFGFLYNHRRSLLYGYINLFSVSHCTVALNRLLFFDSFSADAAAEHISSPLSWYSFLNVCHLQGSKAFDYNPCDTKRTNSLSSDHWFNHYNNNKTPADDLLSN